MQIKCSTKRPQWLSTQLAFMGNSSSAQEVAELGGTTMDSCNVEEDFISCALCMERYDDESRKPKYIDCHHSFCKTCIQVSLAATPQSRLLLSVSRRLRSSSREQMGRQQRPYHAWFLFLAVIGFRCLNASFVLFRLLPLSGTETPRGFLTN